MTKTNNEVDTNTEVVEVQELQRANKVSVLAENGKYIGRFWRTHTLLTEIDSEEQEWKPLLEGLGKVAERELFRVWICENASKFGIEYDPKDRRIEGNKFPRKYDSDELLGNTAIQMTEDNVQEWVDKIQTVCNVPLTMMPMTVDSIEEITERNGKTVNAKYLNGNWAYATINLIATVAMQGGIEQVEIKEGYVTMQASLVSGQLKKPEMTYTNFYDELAIDLPEIKPLKDDKQDDKQDNKKGNKKDDKQDNKKGGDADKPVKLTKAETLAKLDFDESDVAQMNIKERKLIYKDGDHYKVMRYDEDFKFTKVIEAEKLADAKAIYKEWK